MLRDALCVRTFVIMAAVVFFSLNWPYSHSSTYRRTTTLPESGDRNLSIWNSSTGHCKRTLVGHDGPVTAIAVFPDGRIVSSSRDNTVRIWNSSTGECERILLSASNNWVTAIAVLPYGRIVSGSDGSVRIWNSYTGQCERTLSTGQSFWVTAIAVLPDGRFVSGSCDKVVRIWNSFTGHCEKTLSGHSARVNAVGRYPPRWPNHIWLRGQDRKNLERYYWSL